LVRLSDWPDIPVGKMTPKPVGKHFPRLFTVSYGPVSGVFWLGRPAKPPNEYKEISISCRFDGLDHPFSGSGSTREEDNTAPLHRAPGISSVLPAAPPPRPKRPQVPVGKITSKPPGNPLPQLFTVSYGPVLGCTRTSNSFLLRTATRNNPLHAEEPERRSDPAPSDRARGDIVTTPNDRLEALPRMPQSRTFVYAPASLRYAVGS
jgi:hypothetical protein